MGSNSSVASLPAYLRMIFWPPGCSESSVRRRYIVNGVERQHSTWQELGHVICLSMNNDPARVLGVVLGDSSAG